MSTNGANFNFHLNRQGPQGVQGIQGETGFSPYITVDTNTAAEYKLKITNENNSFITDNLRGSAVDDQGGTYMRYDPSTQMMFAGQPDYATELQYGVVMLATDEDIELGAGDKVVTAGQLFEAIETVTTDVTSTVTTLETALAEETSTRISQDTLLDSRITSVQNSIGNGILTITQGTTQIGTFTANSTTNVTVDIPVPTTITVDTAMSSTSENPVQNKVIYNQFYMTSTAVSGLTGRVSTIENDYLTSFDKTSSVSQGNTKLPTSEAVYSAISTAVSDLPVATASTKGIVKPDNDTIIIDQYGTISVDTDELNKASTTNLGVVAVDGTTITADSYGVISATQPTYSTTVTSTDTTQAPTSAAVYDFVTTQVSQVTVDKATSTTLGTVMPDNSTITVNSSGVISAAASAPTNMVTTDTAQDITATKTFDNKQIFKTATSGDTRQMIWNNNYQTGKLFLSNNNTTASSSYTATSALNLYSTYGVTSNYSGSRPTYTSLYTSAGSTDGKFVILTQRGDQYGQSGNNYRAILTQYTQDATGGVRTEIKSQTSGYVSGTLTVKDNSLTFRKETAQNVYTDYDLLNPASTVIDDSTTTTTSTWSSTEIEDQITTAISTATSTMVTSTTIRTMSPVTQSNYDDLVEGGTVDANTLYVITDAS